MENKFTPELIEKAKQAKSLEEAMKHEVKAPASGELSDDALDNVSGGAVLDSTYYMAKCTICGWQSAPFDNKGTYDLDIVAWDNINKHPNCESNFVVYNFNSNTVRIG